MFSELGEIDWKRNIHQSERISGLNKKEKRKRKKEKNSLE